MKVQLKVAGMFTVLLLLATTALTHGPKVQCGSERKDHWNGEARRHPSPYEGDRHVEGPVLREVSRQQSGSSGAGGGWQGRRTSECRAVSFAGAVGEGRQPEIFDRSGIRSEGMHVHAARYSDGRRAGIQGDHQRSDGAQHPSRAESHDGQHPMEPLAAARCARRSFRAGRRKKWPFR